jgi:acetyl-CoA carboxylase carboxyl transferase subunit alpha
MGQLLKRALGDALRQFNGTDVETLLVQRHARLMAYGKFKESVGRARA